MGITNVIINEIKSNQEWQQKMPRQDELEAKMRGMGIDRYWNRAQKAAEHKSETTVKPVRRLLTGTLGQVAEGVDSFVGKAYSGKAGARHAAVKFIEQLDADAVALLTVRCVLDGITRGDTLIALASRIGLMIMDEVQFRSFEEKDKREYMSLKDKYEKQSGHYRHKRNAMRHHMDVKGVAMKDWTPAERVQVGAACLDIMIQTTGMIQQVTRTIDVKRQETVIVATQETMAWIQEAHNRCAALSPVLLPTIVPPKPWTSPFNGGYWTQKVRRMSIVKSQSKGYLQELCELEMPEVYDAVNVMQHTAWMINSDVLAVAKHLWDTGSQLGVIPPATDLPLPVRPTFLDDKSKPDAAWTEEEKTAFREWKRSATDTYTMNAKLKSLRLQFVKTMMVAESFEIEDEIFFPHQLDFRGRAYAIPMYLNPQGADLARGLLEFANGSSINDDTSRSWLAIHGCNCYGNDKVSLEDRVRWVEDNEQMLLAIAADPYENKEWVDADKPWQFLAFCFEWAAFKAHGWGFVSTLPIQMDGSCNGLQNFSAALRDTTGGIAVNLVPAEMPQDIYQKVADVVLERVKKDACDHENDLTMHIAQGWLQHGITRKVCKRPVMTLAYGAKVYGFQQQVFEDTVAPAKYDKSKPFPWSGTGWKAASYLGKVIWECVGTVVVSAREAMDWFQKAASVASSEGLPVRWTTPDGLVVLQAYPVLDIKRINLTFNGHRHYLTVATGESTKLDKRKQSNGISPNWVHSMDASHMRATLRQGWREGLRSFSLIHDSYGTHAGNAEALAQILREAFIEMYSDDVLHNFKEELTTQLPVKHEGLPNLPPKGTLNLEVVKDSLYFFA